MAMVPIVEMSGKLETLASLVETPLAPVMENGSSVKLPEDKMMICSSNCEDNSFDEEAGVVAEDKQTTTCGNNSEDNAFHMEASPSSRDHTMPSNGGNEVVEVDILGDEERVAERVESQDVTESSSSFGSTDSEAGNAGESDDMEVESQVQNDHASSSMRLDGFNDVFRTRKKKLTNHWRKFIRPLMWRCKWVELHLRELHSQMSKYDTQLAEYDRKKQIEPERCPTEDVGIKSTPFISQNGPVKLMKRKKRKRVEETVDLASYSSTHSIFSYYRCKRPFAGSTCMDDDSGNNDVNPGKKTPFGSDEFGISSGWAPSQFKDRDAFESILRKIDEAQLKVHQLKVRMHKVVTEHAAKITSDGSSLALADPSHNCTPNSALIIPHLDTEKPPSTSAACTASQQQGQVPPLPDMSESTDQPKIEVKCEKMGNDLQTYDGRVKQELNTEEVEVEHTESPLASRGKAEDVQTEADPNSANQNGATPQQSASKTRSISKLVTPKNKRKRGRRKARSSRWSRKSSG